MTGLEKNGRSPSTGPQNRIKNFFFNHFGRLQWKTRPLPSYLQRCKLLAEAFAILQKKPTGRVGQKQKKAGHVCPAFYDQWLEQS
jgi:hypothetical protein